MHFGVFEMAGDDVANTIYTLFLLGPVFVCVLVVCTKESAPVILISAAS